MPHPESKRAQLTKGKNTIAQTKSDPQRPPAEPASQEDYMAELSKRGKILRGTLKRILPTLDTRARALLAKAITMKCDGEHWTDIAGKTGLTWVNIAVLCRTHKDTFGELWHSAEDCGEGLRQALREEAADRRAIDGYDEPVFDLKRGVRVGFVRRYSDRLLELKLKAGNPAKYADKHQVDVRSNQPAAMVIWNVTGVTLGQQPPPKVYDLPQSSPEDATKALPETAESEKPQ